VRSLPRVDVIIVGLGAAGGVAADVLTRAGMHVVGIEAGPYLTKKDFLKHLDEIEGCFGRNILGEAKFNHEIPTWRPDVDTAAGTSPIVWPMMNAVGGTSIHYGAQSWRLNPSDFRVRSDTVRRYGERALPTGSSIADWPVTYEELEPYYDRVEYEIGVCGRRGANPFEGRRTRDYPMPPLQPTGYTKKAEDAMRRLGYHPFPQPAAINSVEFGGRAPCSYCGFCSGFGCWNDSKASTLVTAIRRAEQTGRLEIRADSAVTRITVNAAGKAAGVEYRSKTGEHLSQPARFVILSSFVFENVRRLLLSRSASFPSGLSNNHGQVGKNYMSHGFLISSGLFEGLDLNLFNGTPGQAVALDDLNGDNFDHFGLGFIRGGIVFTYNNNLPIAAASGIPPDIPRWGQKYKDWLRKHARSVGSMYSQLETLPYESNFLDLDPAKTDRFGDPVIRITYRFNENETRAGRYISDRLEQVLRAMGAVRTWAVLSAIPVPVSTHVFGGTRMGRDPATSVVDSHCISHEVQNLAILGGSTFVSASGYNPTQTIQALSWRSAEYIAGNFERLAA
jgi:gluconate 2-dehydrogenase alpha chain